MSNVGGGSCEEQGSVIISKSNHWLKRRSRLKVFLFLALAAMLFNRAKRFMQFCRESPKEYSCIIISKSFKIHPLVKAEKSFKGVSIFSPGGHFVQLSGTV